MKRVFTLLLCVLLAAMPLVGCTGESGQLDADKIRIALVCREGMDYNVSRYQKGMEMALGEYEGPYQVTVETHGLDTMDFEGSMEMIESLADNPDITAVVTMQDYEVINAAARVMNDSGKALFAVQGYYDETVQEGYNTFFPFSLNAEHLGYAIGLYAFEAGARRVGCIHSGTEFELDEIVGFGRAMTMVNQADNETDTGYIELGSSLSEPFGSVEFSQEMATWKALGIDTAYVPYYRSLWGADILCAVRNAQPDMRLLTCFTLGSQATVDMLEDIEGAVMPAFYPVDQSAEYKECAKRYEEKYGETPENEAVQGYDIANLVIENYDGDNKRLADNLRKNAGNAAGIAGNIVPDLLQGLSEPDYDVENPYDYEYLMVKDGKLVHTEP